MKIYALLFLIFVSRFAWAEDISPIRVQAYLIQNGETNTVINSRKFTLIKQYDNPIYILDWEFNIPKPTEAMLPSESLATNIYLGQVQKNKQVPMKIYENAFYVLSKSVLQLAGDPRGDLPVAQIPKLSFDELNTILDALIDTTGKEKQANKLSLKLLSVNSALQRYDIKWWDNAVYHAEVN